MCNSTLIQCKNPCLTSLIEAIEHFWQFDDPVVRQTAIAFHAKELGIPQLHFYTIALRAGLGGV